MPEIEETITNCESCGNAMDVSAVAPFSNVECPTCGAKSRVKREFGHYTLTRRLAEGGMSLVFVAMDNTLGREVVLKILNEDYSADERRIEAFVEEARITASFSHPHVVRVFTTGRAFGRFYIAMELVPGGHFEHQIRERGKIPEIEILPFAVQVAEGLEAARKAGLIHRDVKPGNILLDAQGNAKIVDFGLALLTKDGSATAQEIWATPYYVPPETIEGQAEDFRSDLYAFGATLYHALAGVPSCDEKSMATDVLRQAKKHVKALRSAAEDVSDDTCAIVDRAMAYNPDARFGSYEEMISQLKVALGRLKKGGGGPAGGKLRKRASVRRGEMIAIGAAALMLLAAVGGGIAWILRKEEPVKKSPQPVAITMPEVVPEESASTKISQRYKSAREAVDSGNYDRARTEFSALRDDPGVQEPTRSFAAVEAVLMALLDGQPGEARKEAKAAAEHIHSTDLAEQKLGETLLGALSRMDDLQAVKRKDLEASGDGSAWALAMMLGGLKNWEQGLTGPAVSEFFQPLSSAHFRSKDQWVRSYQTIANAYLADYEILTDPVFAAIPGDIPSCRAGVSRLETLLGQIKTRGRVRFNIRALQLDTKRQIKLLETPVLAEAAAGGNPVPAPTAPASPAGADKEPESVFGSLAPSGAMINPLIRLDEFAKACRFAEAKEFIKSLTIDPSGATRESLLTAHSSALDFLTLLEADISRSGIPVQLRLKSGQTLAKVKVAGPGKLFGETTEGSSEFGWGDVEPGSVIEFYRSSVRTRVNEAGKALRDENAITYDWLVGDRSRAATAAERLGIDNPAFKKRWDGIISGLPR